VFVSAFSLYLKFQIKNVAKANQAAVISLKKTVLKFAVLKTPTVTKIPKYSFSLVKLFERRAAQSGDKRLKIDKMVPIKPAPIVLARMSLCGCVNLLVNVFGRCADKAVNLFEISYPQKGFSLIVLSDADHSCSLIRIDEMLAPLLFIK